LLLLLPVGLLLAERALRFRAYSALALLAVSLLFVADYALFFTLATSINFFVARAVFYEIAPGVAALCIWLVSLRLAAYAKARALASPDLAAELMTSRSREVM
jgi:hypothetical protein